MINIANYTNFDINKCMNALQNSSYNWHDITTVDGVTRLWVSDNIYIAINDDNINCFHTNGAFFWISSSTSYNSCTIIQTDNSIVFYVGEYDIIIVSKTKDINGNESAGVISRTSNSNWYMLTDNMINYRPIPIDYYIANSTSLTQLIPICNPDGNEYFKDAFWVFMKKEYDQGKVILNNEYFYIYKNIAVKYTSSE